MKLNKDTFTRYVYAVLRAAGVPYIDPCTNEQVGDCICEGSGGGTGSDDGTVTGFTLVGDQLTITSSVGGPFTADLSSLLFDCSNLATCSLADLGTRDYADLQNTPTSLSQFSNDLTNSDITDSLGFTALTQNAGSVTGTIDLTAGTFTLDGSTFSCADLNSCSLTDMGTANYSDLNGTPVNLSDFVNDLGALTQDGGNITGTIDLSAGTFTLNSVLRCEDVVFCVNTNFADLEFNRLTALQAQDIASVILSTDAGQAATIGTDGLILVTGAGGSDGVTTSGVLNQGTEALDFTVTGGTDFSVDLTGLESIIDPSLVSYDNTTSGATSTNIQDAIDEALACCHNAVTLDAGVNPSLSIVDQVLNLDLSAAGSYDNTTSGSTSDSVQGAIDELFTLLHDAATLGASSNPALTLAGQEFTLDLTAPGSYDNTTSGAAATDIQGAIDEALACCHDEATVSATSNPGLTITGQELNLDLDATGSYDNTTSALTSDSVQDAIDELAARVPTWFQEEYTATGGETSFTLAGAPPQAQNQTFVYLGGQKIPNSQYTLAGGTITFTSITLNAGDLVEVQYVNY